MILLYSGHACKTDRPEKILAKQNPGIMLTYFEMYKGNGETLKRFLRHEKRRTKAKRRKEQQ